MYSSPRVPAYVAPPGGGGGGVAACSAGAAGAAGAGRAAGGASPGGAGSLWKVTVLVPCIPKALTTTWAGAAGAALARTPLSGDPGCRGCSFPRPPRARPAPGGYEYSYVRTDGAHSYGTHTVPRLRVCEVVFWVG